MQAGNYDPASQIGIVKILAKLICNDGTTFHIKDQIPLWTSVECMGVTRSVLVSEYYSIVNGKDHCIIVKKH